MTMTLSPQSACGVKLGLCLPRRMLAMIVATRPTTRPSASISTHFFSTVAAFADWVVLVSAFMARSLTEMDLGEGPERSAAPKRAAPPGPTGTRRRFGAGRSEEHTSEIQSLMRISYAVFCLKKKNKDRIIKTE